MTRVAAPPTASDIVDQLETFFRGDQPASTLAGLLEEGLGLATDRVALLLRSASLRAI